MTTVHLADDHGRDGNPNRTATAYPDSPNTDLLSRIPTDALTIVDVGCGTGALGAAYREVNPKARLFGIERDPDAAAIAGQRLDVVACVDVEQTPLPFELAEGIDCLIYGDVLQQLRDPLSVLRCQLEALNPNGTVLICVPNAEHWSLTARLLRGTWDYEHAGLLDIRHLRWFSLRTFAQMLTDAGLEIEEVQPRVFAPEKVGGFAEAVAPALRNLNIDEQDYVSRAAPLQYIVRARRLVAPVAAKSSPQMLDFVFRGSEAPVFFLPAVLAGDAAAGSVRVAPDNQPPVGRPYACVVTIWDFWRLDPARCANAGTPHFSSAIEPAILDDVRAGRAVLLLDLTNEGPEFDKSAFDHIHNVVDSRMLPADRVIWLAQNRAVEGAYHAAFRRNRPPIGFLYYDFYVKMLAHFFSKADWRAQVLGEDEAYFNRLWDISGKDHVVLCLNATPRTHRVLAIAALMHHGVFQDCLVSFGGLQYDKGPRPAEALIAEVARSSDYAYLTAPCAAVCRIPSLKVDEFAESGNKLWNKIDTRCYLRTFLSLVTETDFTAGSIDRVTEKIVKAFCLGHPVMTLGNPGSIRTMRDWGFNDFGDVLPPDYDGIGNPGQRFRTVFDALTRQIEALRADPTGWVARVREVSAANLAHAANGFVHTYHDRCEGPLLAKLRRLLAS